MCSVKNKLFIFDFFIIFSLHKKRYNNEIYFIIYNGVQYKEKDTNKEPG